MNIFELKQKLNYLGVSTSAYSINSEFDNEQACLEYINGRWCCYYSERGLRTNEKYFYSEDKACKYFYKLLEADPTVRN